MSTKIEFDGGLTCSLPVRDHKAAMAWYESVLGFTKIYELEHIGWCELGTGVARVNLGLSTTENPKVEGGCTLTFGVKDIEASKAALVKMDVRTDGDIIDIEGMVKLLTFYDPDGNHLMFYEDLSQG